MSHGLKLLGPVLALFILSTGVLADSGQTTAPPPQAALGIETVVNLGVPVGNAPLPRFLALNSVGRQLYVLSEGEAQQGNLLTVFDLESRKFSRQIRLNRGDFEPLGLEFDPTAGLLYALVRERYGSTRPVLAVIDSKILQVTQQIPDIEAFTVDGGLLYAVKAGELLAVNLANNSLEQAQQTALTPGFSYGPLAVDSANNRLYLARSADSSASIDIFEASTLSPLANAMTDSKIINLLPQPATNQLLFTTDQGGFRILNRITSQGELSDLPIELGPYSGAAGIALSPDGASLFYSNGQWGTDPGEEPALVELNAATLNQTQTIPLLTNVDDLVIDDQMDRAYAVYPFDHHLYLIDLSTSTFEIENTAIRLRDALFDASNKRLFVTDSANRVRRLDPVTLEPQTETRLQNNWADYGFKRWGWSGQLALDSSREQLYVSGLPGTVLDAATLSEIATIDPGGQFEPDPGGDTVYLSNCGITPLNADTLSRSPVIPGTAARPDGLSPNPCVTSTRLDSDNRWLYAVVSNGVPGSNSGSYLYVYDVSVQPNLIFSDTNISLTDVTPDPADRRAFVSYIRHSNRRLFTLDVPEKKYTHQLMGVWGKTRYSPTSNRLFVIDRAWPRLLVLDADTLDVQDELQLPGPNFRLAALDSSADRLYLLDDRGNLLTAAPGAKTPPPVEPSSALAGQADGPVLELTAPGDGPIFARIDSRTGEFSHEPHLYRRSDANNQSWAAVDQGLPPLPVEALAVSPTVAADQTLFTGLLAAGQTGGLYKSIDGGNGWQPAMTGLRDLWVNSLTIAPDFAETGLIFAETTYGGLHFSADGGDIWQPIAEPDPNGFFPTSSSEYAVAIGPDSILISQPLEAMRGIFRATRRPNGDLSSWQPVLDQTAALLAISPDGKTALALGSILWSSTDSGRTWQAGGAGLFQDTSAQPQQFIFSPNFKDDQTAYLFYRDPTGNEQAVLFRSTDGGQNWFPWQPAAGSPIFSALTMTADGDFLLGDAVGQLTQLAPGNLRYATSNLPTGLFPLDSVAAAGSGDILFAASGAQGVFKSTNGGRSWNRTAYPVRTQPFGSRPFRVAAAGSGKTVFVASGFSLHRSTDGGTTWQPLASGDGSLSFPAQQVALSPTFDRDQTLLANTPGAVYRSRDGGDNWARVLAVDSENWSTDVLAFAPDGRTAYVRFGYGQPLYSSDDGGQTWAVQPTSSGDEYFSILNFATNNQGLLTAAVEYDRKLLQTGPQTPPWRNLSELLPPELTSVNAVGYRSNGNLYVGGQGGLFVSSDNGQSWQAQPTYELPANATITGLAVTDSVLVVSLDTGEIFRFTEGEFGWKAISIIK